MLLRVIAFLLLSTVAVPSFGQVLAANPVAKAVQNLVKSGLTTGETASQSPLSFRSSGNRISIDGFIKSLSDDAGEQEVFKQLIVEAINGFEQEAVSGGYANDGAAALAFAVGILYAAIHDQEFDDLAFDAMIGQLRASLGVTVVKLAGNRHKQEFYETSLYYAGLIIALSASTQDAQALDNIKTLASAYLSDLLGTDSDRISISARGLKIKPAKAAELAPRLEATGLRSDFSFTVPAGYSRQGEWYIFRNTENRGGGDEITSAMLRFLPPIAPKGNMGDALRVAWQTGAPAELTDKAGNLVYRRYVGDGLLSQFIFGTGREQGRAADTLFTVYLIDCGQSWQPFIVAQTYEEPDNNISSSVALMGSMSFGNSAQMAEPMLASLRCQGTKRSPLADTASLAGHYYFGSASSLQWINVYTGATSMTAVSYGGELDLQPNGAFDYKFTSASGLVGAMNIATDNGGGRWTVSGDLLTLSRDSGATQRYRIAGLTQFTDGTKIAVLMHRLDLPINPTTVTDGGNLYSTRSN